MSSNEKLKDYSTTPANNNASPPDGWPEGMAASKANDTNREFAARVKEWYDDALWINDGLTKTFVSSTQFKITGQDETATYTVGRRVEAIGTSTGTIYGTITASAFSTDTTVTVSWDSGSLSNESLTISFSLNSNKAGTAENDNSSLVQRDSNGRFKATDPSAAQDVATKNWVEAGGQDLSSNITINSNTNWHAGNQGQIFVDDNAPTSGDGVDGDIWLEF